MWAEKWFALQKAWNREGERKKESKKDRHPPYSSSTCNRNNVFVQTRAHTHLPGQFCCHMLHTKTKPYIKVTKHLLNSKHSHLSCNATYMLFHHGMQHVMLEHSSSRLQICWMIKCFCAGRKLLQCDHQARLVAHLSCSTEAASSNLVGG